MQQQQQQSTNDIHCKVQYGDEFRRFVYDNSEYSSFLQQIKGLFGFNNSDEVVLKYKDDEGDMVTIASDEELEFAIDVFSGSILRLSIFTPNRDVAPAQCPPKPNYRPHHEPGQFGGPWGPHGRCRGRKEKMGGHCGKEGRGAQWRERWIAKLQENPELLSKKIDMLTKKRDLLKTRLEWIQNKDSSCPRKDHRKIHIACKLKKVESILAHLQSITTNPTNATEPIVIQNQVPIEKPETKASLKEEILLAREKKEAMAKVFADEHKQMLALKSEIQALRTQPRTPDNIARIASLKEAIGNFRALHQQKRAELQVQDATIRNLRSKIQNLKKENL